MLTRMAPLLFRRLPSLLKISAFSLGFLYLNYHSKLFTPAQCIHVPSFSNNIFTEVLPKIIRIEEGG